MPVGTTRLCYAAVQSSIECTKRNKKHGRQLVRVQSVRRFTGLAQNFLRQLHGTLSRQCLHICLVGYVPGPSLPNLDELRSSKRRSNYSGQQAMAKADSRYTVCPHKGRRT